MNISKETKVVRVMNAQAAGTSALQSASVDMQGFDAVQFVALAGAVAAAEDGAISISQSDDDTTFATLAGTGMDVDAADGNKMFVSDIERPTGRYLRCEISRGTCQVAVDGVIAILYKGRTKPADVDATVAAAEHHVSPEEGAA